MTCLTSCQLFHLTSSSLHSPLVYRLPCSCTLVRCQCICSLHSCAHCSSFKHYLDSLSLSQADFLHLFYHAVSQQLPRYAANKHSSVCTCQQVCMQDPCAISLLAQRSRHCFLRNDSKCADLILLQVYCSHSNA